MDDVPALRGDLARVVDHLARLEPRPAGRQQQRLDRVLRHRERVAGVEERAVDHEAGVLDHRDVPVQGRVQVPVGVHVEPGGGERVPLVHHVHLLAAEPGELAGHRGVGPQLQARVGGERGAQAIGVEVVEVLVRDQHRAGPFQRPRHAPGRGVDDQRGPVLLQPDAGVLKLRQPHEFSPDIRRMFMTLPGVAAADPADPVPPWWPRAASGDTAAVSPGYPYRRRQRCPVRTACLPFSTSWC